MKSEWQSCRCDSCKRGGYTWSEHHKMQCLASYLASKPASDRAEFFSRWAAVHGDKSSAKLAKFVYRAFPHLKNPRQAPQRRLAC